MSMPSTPSTSLEPPPRLLPSTKAGNRPPCYGPPLRLFSSSMVGNPLPCSFCHRSAIAVTVASSPQPKRLFPS
ncbi:hypothetical protein GW17_00007594 [Ensete ventricosum]|nr:hypothetical protein GW17_00007594 [Ensete ventricosum]